MNQQFTMINWNGNYCQIPQLERTILKSIIFNFRDIRRIILTVENIRIDPPQMFQSKNGSKNINGFILVKRPLNLLIFIVIIYFC